MVHWNPRKTHPIDIEPRGYLETSQSKPELSPDQQAIVFDYQEELAKEIWRCKLLLNTLEGVLSHHNDPTSSLSSFRMALDETFRISVSLARGVGEIQDKVRGKILAHLQGRN